MGVRNRHADRRSYPDLVYWVDLILLACPAFAVAGMYHAHKMLKRVEVVVRKDMERDFLCRYLAA